VKSVAEQRYFCARDHFGTKPFYYTFIDNEFAFSSSLNELRQNPKVSDTLNEIAIGDYLLFGVNQDLSTTIFKDIHRLPPAHTLTVANGTLKIRRYWSPEPTSEIRYRNAEDYVEHFSDLLSQAVSDRLTSERVAISMSGGLDSSSLAAVARKQNKDVHAFTVVYDTLIADEERHYSTLAAHHLGIPITHLNADQYSLFEERSPGALDQPEPFQMSPLTGQFHDLLRLCGDFAPVAFTGYDGDAFMNEARPPRFRSKLKRLLRKRRDDAVLPGWIDESFARRTNLLDRLRNPARIDPGSPANPMWTALFESYAPASTKLPLEVRHPFMDIRLIEFLLAIPKDPWRIDKHILRVAMKTQLPAAVVNRRKTPLAGDPALQLARHASVRWLDSFEVSPQLSAFVNLNRRRKLADEETSDGLWANLRVFALNYWLTYSRPAVQRTSQAQVTTAAVYPTSIA
jgi:asparagine synthase (glutamine-hydrolysing)